MSKGREPQEHDMGSAADESDLVGGRYTGDISGLGKSSACRKYVDLKGDNMGHRVSGEGGNERGQGKEFCISCMLNA